MVSIDELRKKKLTQEAVTQYLLSHLREGKWDIVSQLCDFDPPPSRESRQEALQYVLTTNEEFWKSTSGVNRPFRERNKPVIPAAVFQQLCKSQSFEADEIVNRLMGKYLVFAKNPALEANLYDIEPYITILLQHCTLSQNIKVSLVRNRLNVDEICQLEGEAALSSENTGILLIDAVERSDYRLIASLCEATNPPPQIMLEQAIEILLKGTHDEINWHYQERFLSLLVKKDELTQDVVDSIFVAAVNYGHWQLVDKLCKSEYGLTPSRKARQTILEKPLQTNEVFWTNNNSPFKQDIFKERSKIAVPIDIFKRVCLAEPAIDASKSTITLLNNEKINSYEKKDYLQVILNHCNLDMDAKQKLVEHDFFTANILTLDDDQALPRDRIDNLLVLAIKTGNEHLVSMLYEAAYPPSQKAVNTAIDILLEQVGSPANKEKGWAIIANLSRLEGEKGPDQSMREKTLINAAQQERWSFVKELTRPALSAETIREIVSPLLSSRLGKNVLPDLIKQFSSFASWNELSVDEIKPIINKLDSQNSQLILSLIQKPNAPDAEFIATLCVRFSSPPFIQELFEKAIHKPEKIAVLSALLDKWLEIKQESERFGLISLIEYLGPLNNVPYIHFDKLLAYAVKSKSTDFFYDLMLMANKKNMSIEAIKSAINMAVETKQSEIYTHLFELYPSLDQEFIDTVFINAARKAANTTYPHFEPSFSLDYFFSLNPSQKAIDEVLSIAVSTKNGGYLIPKLFALSEQRPSQEGINNATVLAQNELNNVKSILSIFTQNLPQEKLDNILRDAASNSCFDVVYILSHLNNSYSPSQEAIDDALKISVENAYLDLTKIICESPHWCPSEKVIGELLPKAWPGLYDNNYYEKRRDREQLDIGGMWPITGSPWKDLRSYLENAMPRHHVIASDHEDLGDYIIIAPREHKGHAVENEVDVNQKVEQKSAPKIEPKAEHKQNEHRNSSEHNIHLDNVINEPLPGQKNIVADVLDELEIEENSHINPETECQKVITERLIPLTKRYFIHLYAAMDKSKTRKELEDSSIEHLCSLVPPACKSKKLGDKFDCVKGLLILLNDQSPPEEKVSNFAKQLKQDSKVLSTHRYSGKTFLKYAGIALGLLAGVIPGIVALGAMAYKDELPWRSKGYGFFSKAAKQVERTTELGSKQSNEEGVEAGDNEVRGGNNRT